MWCLTSIACEAEDGFRDPHGNEVSSEQVLHRFEPQLVGSDVVALTADQLLIAGETSIDVTRFGRRALWIDLARGRMTELPPPSAEAKSLAWAYKLVPLDERHILAVETMLLEPSHSAIFDVQQRSWRSLETPRRMGAHSVLLQTGQVLNTAGPRKTRLFDPVSERWRELTDAEGDADSGTLTLLADGRALVTGLSTNDSDAPPGAWLFDPASERYLPVTPPRENRQLATAVRLDDVRVLLIGGQATGDRDLFASSEIWDSLTDTWSEGPSLPAPRAFGSASCTKARSSTPAACPRGRARCRSTAP